MEVVFWMMVLCLGCCRGDIGETITLGLRAVGLDVDADVDEQQPSRELNVTDLDYFVNTEEGKAVLEKEFEGIKGGQRKPWTVAEEENNLWKNRYTDLLAFDDTRVKLPYENGSDYINANYVNGYHGEKEYIATQGPLPNTTHHFWAMIWDQKVTKIVMLANLLEHGKPKVAKYWPEVTGIYGDIVVTKLSEVQFPKLQHVVRTFLLNKPGSSPTPRLVKHFHYIGWPDLGVPDDRMSVLALMDQVRRYTPPGDDDVPIVIHCSAGVGRTGTVILTDSMWQSAKYRGEVDFPKRLNSMRLQRVDVVEKKEQYIFAHHAVYDAIFSSETQAYLKKANNAYRNANYGSVLELLKVPKDLGQALRQLKWHNVGMQLITNAIEKGFTKIL